MEKVSIIIPIYNVPEKLLNNCINSCIEQTYENIEIILIDDGSKDNSGKICDDYSKKDSRIIVIHQENKGLSGARNTGVKKSSGDWIFFLDGDDYIDKDAIKILIELVQKNEVDLICFSYISKSEKNEKRCYFNDIEEKIYRNEDCKILQEKVLDCNSRISSSWCKLIKRDLLIKNNLFHNEDVRQGAEDVEFTIRLFEYSKNVLVKNIFLYYYIYNNNSITKKYNEENFYRILKCFESIKDFISKNSNKEKLLDLFYTRMAYAIITTTISGYFSKSNTENFKTKKEKYLNYLEQPLVKECLKKCYMQKLDIRRKMLFILIKIKALRIIDILVRLFR